MGWPVTLAGYLFSPTVFEIAHDLPRIAEGKYLKLLHSLHEARGTLAAVPADLCPACDLSARCPVEGKLSVYCLEGCFVRF